jgi:hypothetical protein
MLGLKVQLIKKFNRQLNVLSLEMEIYIFHVLLMVIQENIIVLFNQLILVFVIYHLKQVKVLN